MNEGDAPPVPKSIPDQFHFTRYTSNPYIRCTIPSPPRRPHQPSPPLPIFIDRFPSEAINWLHRNCSGFFCSELPARLGRRFPQAGGSEARPVRILQPARVRALAAPGCFLQIDSMGGLLAAASGLREAARCSWPQLLEHLYVPCSQNLWCPIQALFWLEWDKGRTRTPSRPETR